MSLIVQNYYKEISIKNNQHIYTTAYYLTIFGKQHCFSLLNHPLTITAIFYGMLATEDPANLKLSCQLMYQSHTDFL